MSPVELFFILLAIFSLQNGRRVVKLSSGKDCYYNKVRVD